MKKNICVLGSTGSVGTQTLEVAKELEIQVDSLSANNNIDLLEKQIRLFKPKIASVLDESKAKILKQKVADTSTKILCGVDGICESSTLSSIDTVITAISGVAGLRPTVEAINFGKNIALANKETLVTAGTIINKLVKDKNVSLLPVDSEHSAIFQCIQGANERKNIKRLILTASGGPFFGKTLSELENITIEQALNHPSWSMGKKISIDSATMMNKGLEVIEAAHLFGINIDDIDVIIHRESVVHSMVEFNDNSIIAQMGTPSMKLPIQYALTYPNHINSQVPSLDFSKYKNLTFFEPDNKNFESINICKQAFKKGISACVVVNAANEKAVEMFLNRRIKFTDITRLVKIALDTMIFSEVSTIEEIEKIDLEVRKNVEELA